MNGLLGAMSSLLDEETVEQGERFKRRMRHFMQQRQQFYGEMEETLPLGREED